MKNTYTLLGISFLLITVGAWYAFSRSPVPENTGITNSSEEHMTSTLSLTSTAFKNGEAIPSHFTCDGENVNPKLSIAGVPESAKSLALIMDDPDVPKALRPDGVFDHWVAFNIPPMLTEIDEAADDISWRKGANGAGKDAYTGPCPPPQYEPSEHRYFFRLYALDTMLDLPAGASKADVLKAMEGHIVGEAELMGRYKRK